MPDVIDSVLVALLPQVQRPDDQPDDFQAQLVERCPDGRLVLRPASLHPTQFIEMGRRMILRGYAALRLEPPACCDAAVRLVGIETRRAAVLVRLTEDWKGPGCSQAKAVLAEVFGDGPQLRA